MSPLRKAAQQVSPTGGYCRRDNRVYAECPLGDNWETCSLHRDCLLVVNARLARDAAQPQPTEPDHPLEPPPI